jgi:cysteinyl-tRNA synthetase
VCDDLNFPQALGVLNLMLKDIDLLDEEKAALVVHADSLLGLGLTEAVAASAAANEPLPDDLAAVLAERNAARAAKDWKKSDELRAVFTARGYVLKDNKDGTTTWSKG